MDEKIRNLIEVMEKEVDLYGEFLHLLQMEKQCITDLSLDRLQKCSNRKEVVIAHLQILEESRKDIIKLIENGNQTGTATLAMIIDMAPSRYNKVLEACRSNLVSLVNSIREINQINSILAERVITHTRHSLSFLNRLVSDLQGHHSSERVQEKKSKGLVCRKG